MLRKTSTKNDRIKIQESEINWLLSKWVQDKEVAHRLAVVGRAWLGHGQEDGLRKPCRFLGGIIQTGFVLHGRCRISDSKVSKQLPRNMVGCLIRYLD